MQIVTGNLHPDLLVRTLEFTRITKTKTGLKTGPCFGTLQGITGEQLYEGLLLLDKRLEELGIVEVDGEMCYIDGGSYNV